MLSARSSRHPRRIAPIDVCGGVVPATWPRGVVPATWPCGVVPATWPRGVVPATWPCGVVPATWPRGVVPATLPRGARHVAGASRAPPIRTRARPASRPLGRTGRLLSRSDVALVTRGTGAVSPSIKRMIESPARTASRRVRLMTGSSRVRTRRIEPTRSLRHVSGM